MDQTQDPGRIDRRVDYPLNLDQWTGRPGVRGTDIVIVDGVCNTLKLLDSVS